VSFTEAEAAYLSAQRWGRLATAAPDGTLQVNPVGYSYNPARGTLDIQGFTMSRTRKFRNVAANGRVAFVVDDIPSLDPFRVRCLEVRGHAEAIADPTGGSEGELDGATICIHPERIISFGLDDDRPPHQLTQHSHAAQH
jgi:pyridoxamine 5'-phosphate oxidase family protein